MTATILLIAGLSVGAPTGPSPGDPVPRTVSMTASEQMQFSQTTINAKPGEQLHVVLRALGTMPKLAMAHNFVLLTKGTNLAAFIKASASARSTNFIAPAFSKNVIAATALAGAGDTVQVTFAAPKAPGRYDFICTFPGHFAAGMRGVLIVK